MTLHLEQLHPLFAAEASGVDLAKPLTGDQVRQIDEAMNRYAVLVFRNQPLQPEQQVALAKSFGPLDLGLKRLKKEPDRMAHEALIDISNVSADGNVADRDSRKIVGNLANQLWHSDSSFQKPAARYSMLSAVVLPGWGGETEFADLRAAYDALPADLQETVSGLEAEHFALHSRFLLGDASYTEEQRALIPPARWPVVRTHPGSGRKLLFVGIHTQGIVGWPVAEGRLLLMDLLEHATQREFVYRHEWQVGDLVIWDNRSTLHRGRRYDIAQRRELRRTTTLDVDDADTALSGAA